MLNKFVEIFGKLAGSGRAWMLNSENIKAVVRSLVYISSQVKILAQSIPSQALPWLCDDTVIPFWERHFGLSYNDGDTIDERRARVVTTFVAVGAQSAGYIDYILTASGFNVEIIEDLSVYGSTLEELSILWHDAYYRLGNGDIYYYDGDVLTIKDPVTAPTTDKEWSSVWRVNVNTTDWPSINTILNLILRYKPTHTAVVIYGVGLDVQVLDATLVTTSDPDLILDASQVNNTTPPAYVLNARLAS